MGLNELRTLFFGQNCLHFPSLSSTNDLAWQLLDEKAGGLAEGTLIWADEQTAGRGQRAASWHSPRGGGLYASFVLYPKFLPLAQAQNLNLALSLGVCQALETWLGRSFKLKWPNDLYCEDFKIGGLLLETRLKAYGLEAAVFGLGINLQAQAVLPSFRASSLASLGLGSWTAQTLLEQVCPQLEKRYLGLKSCQTQDLLVEYESKLWSQGQWRKFYDPTKKTKFQAQVLGLCPQGGLRLGLDDGSEEHYLGAKSLVWLFDET